MGRSYTCISIRLTLHKATAVADAIAASITLHLLLLRHKPVIAMSAFTTIDWYDVLVELDIQYLTFIGLYSFVT